MGRARERPDGVMHREDDYDYRCPEGGGRGGRDGIGRWRRRWHGRGGVQQVLHRWIDAGHEGPGESSQGMTRASVRERRS